MINDYKILTSSQGLHYFIGLKKVYHNYTPYFEVRIKPLSSLYRDDFCKDVPLMAWSPELIQLFEDTKKCITSLPIMARFDPTKPVFIKTYWSEEGMDWILMQTADEE